MRERWGTFSVRDHLEPRAFVADAILYDRLVVPYPNSTKEREHWSTQGWDPGRQDRLLAVITRVEKKTDQRLSVRIPWDEGRRSTFTDKYKAAQAADHETVDGYWLTAHQLMTDKQLDELRTSMPVRPKAVCAYVSRRQLTEEIPLAPITHAEPEDPETRKQQLAIVLGHEILVPDDSAPACEEQDLELLERALRLSSADRVKEKRAAFYAWVDKAAEERLTNDEALHKMRELLDGYNEEIKRATTQTRIEQAFLVTGTGLVVAGHFFPPLWLGAVMVAPARYLVGRKLADDRRMPWMLENKPAAMFHEARHELARNPLG